MRTNCLNLLILLLLASCTKNTALFEPGTGPVGFTGYHIEQGAHYTVENAFVPVDTAALDFTVQFDSSAIYTTADPANQYDINKLYGFADNGAAHHEYSARFGWRWSDNALRLFAYVYNGGDVLSKELGPVAIGAPIHCRIAVSGKEYQFTCNEWVTDMPRESTTTTAKGYLLYPYFGGDETAPHDVTIWIRNN